MFVELIQIGFFPNILLSTPNRLCLSERLRGEYRYKFMRNELIRLKSNIMNSKYLLFLALAGFLFGACNRDKCDEVRTYVRYDPVYTTTEEYRVPIQAETARVLKEPGKIYFYNQYILINEIREGIHVIDNQDPSNPNNIAFIPIPGNIDMAIMNDMLYVDAYTDLVILDINNINQPQVVDRKEDVFNSHYHSGPQGILSHYKESEITEDLDCSMDNFGSPFFFRRDVLMIDSASEWSGTINNASGSGAPSVGQGGSMARFTISKSHLYAIGDRTLFSMPITGSGQVGNSVETPLPWGIETIFPYNDYLFVGANDGLHIVDINTPTSPVHVSTFQHASACDPVVVQDDIAFVTLRSGNDCQGFTDQLEVIDVKDILNPRLLHSFKMDNPHGLAVDGQELFLCEGSHGLKVFNIQDVSKIPTNLKSHLKGFDAYDAIAIHGKTLLVIGKDGFRQYDYSDPSKLKLLSNIPVIRS